MAGVDREEVGRKLGFLETVRDHVRVRKRDFDPGFQRCHRSVADRKVQFGRRNRHHRTNGEAAISDM